MAITEQLKNLVDQLPDAAGNGMYTGNMDKDNLLKSITKKNRMIKRIDFNILILDS